MAVVQLDPKLPLLGLALAFGSAAALHYGLDTRVTVLDAKAKATERVIDKQDDVLKDVASSLASVEKVLIKFDARLEKIEYRLGNLETRISRLDKGIAP